MDGHETKPRIWVGLSVAQAEQVIQQTAASDRPGSALLRLLLALGGRDTVVTLPELEHDSRYHSRQISQSVAIALMVLAPFASEPEHKVTVLARALEMSTTTAVRYLKTWVAIGILEQDEKTRAYRLAI